MGAAFGLWAEMSGRGLVQGPRTGRGVDGFAASLAGCLLVGTPRQAGGLSRLFVAQVSGDGLASVLPFDIGTDEAARSLAARLRFRSGAAHVQLRGTDAEAAFMVQAMLEGLAFRHVVAEGAARDALVAYAHGAGLDLASLPSAPAFDPVMDCPEGGRWRRVAGLQGAVGVAGGGIAQGAARFAWDIARGGDATTDGRHYVLDMPDGDGLAAWVRVPGPEADPFELPEVAGPDGEDPFRLHAGRIADLGRAVDAMLGRRHCVPAGAGTELAERRLGPA